jgi:flavin reductase (DIM6/NTAB) family NADH-FMN oxidoreductase RutF
MTVAMPDVDRRAAFRRAVGAFPTGVCVVAAERDGSPAGMTLNSFTSVSLEPLLVLVSLAHGARTLEAVRASGRFALSILHRGQSEIALEFAARGSAFPVDRVHRLGDGSLVVRHALAHLLCDVDSVVTAGDHDLVIGAVREFEASPGEPLVFHGGRFGGVAVDADAPSGFAALLDEGIGW